MAGCSTTCLRHGWKSLTARWPSAVLADDKTGKEQAECGLTCDLEGRPAAVEVFAGNTTDPSVFIKALDGLGEATGA